MLDLTQPTSTDRALGRRAMERLAELDAFTDEPGMLTRLYLSPAHRRAVRHAARLGAALTIVSTIGSGTEVTLIVPGGIAFRASRPTRLSKLIGFFNKTNATSLDDSGDRRHL